MAICPNCKNETDSIKSVVAKSSIVTGCDNCLARVVQKPNDMAAKSRRGHDVRKHGADIVQSSDMRAYRETYGLDALRQHYDDETIRKYS